MNIMYSIVDSGFMISNRFVFESTLTVLWFRPTVDALPMASLQLWFQWPRSSQECLPKTHGWTRTTLW